MRYPYERYLLYLIARRVDVNQTLARYGLPPVGLRWLAETESRLREETPIQIQIWLDKRTDVIYDFGEFADWTAKEGTTELWNTEKVFGRKVAAELDISLRIFLNTSARCVLGMMLVANIGDPWIIEVFQERFDIELNDKSIRYYRDMFWNPGIMSRGAWSEFADILVSKEERHYISFALTAPRIEQIRYALDMPVSMDPDAIVKDIMVKSWFKYTEVCDTANPSDANIWANLALKAHSSLTGKKGNLNEISTAPADVSKMFSVQIERAEHAVLNELQGELSSSAGPKKKADG